MGEAPAAGGMPSGLMLAAFLGALIVFLIAVLLAGLVLPLWAFVHCVMSPSLSTTQRVLWAIGILLLWPLAALAYGIVQGSNRWLRWLSCTAPAIIATVVIGLLVWGLPLARNYLRAEAQREVAALEKAQTELSPDEIGKVRAALMTLSADLGPGLMAVPRQRINGRLVELLGIRLADGRLDRAEYDDWLAKFQSRGSLDEERLADEVNTIRRDVTPAPRQEP